MIYIICSVIALIVFGLDMLTKHLAVYYSVNKVIIPKLLKFKLTYNTGAAFSFLGEHSWAITFFVILTIIVLVGIIAFMIYNIVKKHKISKWFAISLALTFGGALGNLVDRLLLKKVRDFIFVLYDTKIFPAIFNVADIALVVGVIMICVYLLFIDKDAVFKVNKENKDGKEDNKN